MPGADHKEDPADALAKEVHAAQLAEGLVQFAKLLIERNGALDVRLVMRCLLAETLAAMAFDHGLAAEDAVQEVATAVQYRIARREDAEQPQAARPRALH